MNLNCGSQGHLNCYFHVEAVEGLIQYLSGLYDEAFLGWDWGPLKAL